MTGLSDITLDERGRGNLIAVCVSGGGGRRIAERGHVVSSLRVSGWHRAGPSPRAHLRAQPCCTRLQAGQNHGGALNRGSA